MEDGQEVERRKGEGRGKGKGAAACHGKPR